MDNFNLKFLSNCYYFIVSLDHDSAAQSIFSDVVKVRCEQRGFKCRYFPVHTGTDFSKVIDEIYEETDYDNGNHPYLHIEAHGDSNHLKFSSDFRVPWSGIAQMLTKINVKSRNNLFVSLASCFGGHLTLEILNNVPVAQTTRAPAFAILGPEKVINYDQLHSGFNEYFDCLLTTRSVSKSVEMLNVHSNYEGRFVLWYAWNVHKTLIDSFIKNYGQKISDPLEEKRVIGRIAREFTSKTGRIFTEVERRKLIDYRRSKDRMMSYLNEIRDQFFMIDLYPENNQRFPKVSDIHGLT